MNNRIIEEAITILLVEDNPADVRLTCEVFREGKIRNNLYIVEDGVEAINFLMQKEKYCDVPKPDLILLDLNLPKKDGRQLLEEIKNDKSLSQIPVMVLTSSRAEEDIMKTYDLRANCYITKPFDFEQFIAIARSIEDFWFSIVRMPKATKMAM